MRGQVTLEALLVMLALSAAIVVWVTAGSGAVNAIKGALENKTVDGAGERIDAMCGSVRAMGEGNSMTARVFVPRDVIVDNVVLRAGWNNVTATYEGYCLLASTTSSQ